MQSHVPKQQLLSMVLVITFLLPLFVGVEPVGANSPIPPDVESERGAYKRLFDKYGLVDADEVPNGVTPLRVNSPEELEKLLESAPVGKPSVIQEAMTVEEIALLADKVYNSEKSSNIRATYTTIRRECTVPVGLATFYTAADIRVGVYGTSYAWIDSVNEWVGLRGYTVGKELKGTYHYHHFDTTTADITGGGVVDWYILVEGGVKVWSMPVECTIHYSIY